MTFEVGEPQRWTIRPFGTKRLVMVSPLGSRAVIQLLSKNGRWSWEWMECRLGHATTFYGVEWYERRKDALRDLVRFLEGEGWSCIAAETRRWG